MIIRSRAPLRLGLAGGGTDLASYANVYGGAILNATIDLYAYATITPSEDSFVQFEALDRNETVRIKAESALAPSGKLDLHTGVYNRVVKEFNNGEPLSLTLRTCSDVPAGSGLGSSSTLVVTMLKAFAEWLNLSISNHELAQLAWEIEREDLGLHGGHQDQFAAAYGGFNFMEFHSGNRVVVNPLNIEDWIISELESSLVLFFTGQSRESAIIIDEQILNIQGNNKSSLSAMHQLKRDAFTMKNQLLEGAIHQFGKAMDLSWRTKKQTANAITNPVIDDIYDLVLDMGAVGGKVSGAGGGGFMIFIVDPIHRMNVIDALRLRKGDIIPCHFTSRGAESWKVDKPT